MTTHKEALTLVLESMKSFQNRTGGLYEGEFEKEIKACEEALAQPSTVNQFHPDYADEAINEMTLTIQKQAQRIEELEAQLAQPEQEPVAYPKGDVVGPCICGSWPGGKCLKCPRITTTQQRTWVGLTIDEMHQLNDALNLNGRFPIIAAIESKLKEKNT